MKPPPLDYVRAQSPAHAADLLQEYGDDAKLLAGGQSLVPMLNMRLARPSVLIDIGHLDAAEIEVGPHHLRAGMLVRHHELEHDPAIGLHQPLLAACAPHIGHEAIRNRGTLGGSISHADATAELPLVALALDASVELLSSSGTRQIPVDELLVASFVTTMRSDEILRSIMFPAHRPGRRYAFRENAERSGDFATAAAACVVDLHQETVTGARIAVAGAGPRPILLEGSADLLAGVRADRVEAEEVARAGVEPLELDDNPLVSSEFRRGLLCALVAETVAEAINDNGGAR